MNIQKIKIISNNICYGPEPSPTDEVEQNLTISSTGRVWFTGYNYGGGFSNYIAGRKKQLSIGRNKASDILSLVSQYFDNKPSAIFATDIGEWEIIITDTDKNNQKFKGSLCGGVTVGDIDLTEYIREHISIDGLFVFDDFYCDEE